MHPRRRHCHCRERGQNARPSPALSQLRRASHDVGAGQPAAPAAPAPQLQRGPPARPSRQARAAELPTCLTHAAAMPAAVPAAWARWAPVHAHMLYSEPGRRSLHVPRPSRASSCALLLTPCPRRCCLTCCLDPVWSAAVWGPNEPGKRHGVYTTTTRHTVPLEAE